MSIPAMNWAFRQIEKFELKESERLILLVLAFKLHSITKQCTPSVETIAKMTGLSERRVQMNVRTLEEKQLVLVKKRSKKGQQLSNQYELLGATKKASPKKITGATGGVTR